MKTLIIMSGVVAVAWKLFDSIENVTYMTEVTKRKHIELDADRLGMEYEKMEFMQTMCDSEQNGMMMQEYPLN